MPLTDEFIDADTAVDYELINHGLEPDQLCIPGDWLIPLQLTPERQKNRQIDVLHTVA